jgi:hypothetical protein
MFFSQNTGAKKFVLAQWKSNHKTRIELRGRFFKDPQDIHQLLRISLILMGTEIAALGF